MSRTFSLVRVLLALLLPIVVLALLVLRAERLVRSGQRWQVRITGYDPRDLVGGQYLQYRIAWSWEDGAESVPPECGAGPCVMCLTRRPDDSADIPEPRVRRVVRARAAACDSFFAQEAEDKLHRYFIPEGMGSSLEAVLRDRSREVRLHLSISGAGQVAITDLLIDGAPWRSVIKK